MCFLHLLERSFSQRNSDISIETLQRCELRKIGVTKSNFYIIKPVLERVSVFAKADTEAIDQIFSLEKGVLLQYY